MLTFTEALAKALDIEAIKDCVHHPLRQFVKSNFYNDRPIGNTGAIFSEHPLKCSEVFYENESVIVYNDYHKIIIHYKDEDLGDAKYMQVCDMNILDYAISEDWLGVPRLKNQVTDYLIYGGFYECHSPEDYDLLRSSKGTVPRKHLDLEIIYRNPYMNYPFLYDVEHNTIGVYKTETFSTVTKEVIEQFVQSKGKALVESKIPVARGYKYSDSPSIFFNCMSQFFKVHANIEVHLDFYLNLNTGVVSGYGGSRSNPWDLLLREAGLTWHDVVASHPMQSLKLFNSIAEPLVAAIMVAHSGVNPWMLTKD